MNDINKEAFRDMIVIATIMLSAVVVATEKGMELKPLIALILILNTIVMMITMEEK